MIYPKSGQGIAVVHPSFFLTFTFIRDAPLHENPIISYIYGRGGEPAYIRRRSYDQAINCNDCFHSFLTFLTMTWERASISSDRASSIPRLMIPSLVATIYTSGFVPIASILFFMQHSSHPSTAMRSSPSWSSSSSGFFRAVSWR